MDKAFIFSMDSAYAIFIILLTSVTLVTIINTSQHHTNREQVYLSRVARDIHDVNQSMDGELDTQNVDWININNCENADTVGTHQAVTYDGEGNLKITKIEVCPK